MTPDTPLFDHMGALDQENIHANLPHREPLPVRNKRHLLPANSNLSSPVPSTARRSARRGGAPLSQLRPPSQPLTTPENQLTLSLKSRTPLSASVLPSPRQQFFSVGASSPGGSGGGKDDLIFLAADMTIDTLAELNHTDFLSHPRPGRAHSSSCQDMAARNGFSADATSAGEGGWYPDELTETQLELFWTKKARSPSVRPCSRHTSVPRCWGWGLCQRVSHRCALVSGWCVWQPPRGEAFVLYDVDTNTFPGHEFLVNLARGTPQVEKAVSDDEEDDQGMLGAFRRMQLGPATGSPTGPQYRQHHLHHQLHYHHHQQHQHQHHRLVAWGWWSDMSPLRSGATSVSQSSSS